MSAAESALAAGTSPRNACGVSAYVVASGPGQPGLTLGAQKWPSAALASTLGPPACGGAVLSAAVAGARASRLRTVLEAHGPGNRQLFIPTDGRVVEPTPRGVTTSEGQTTRSLCAAGLGDQAHVRYGVALDGEPPRGRRRLALRIIWSNGRIARPRLGEPDATPTFGSRCSSRRGVR